jgi:thiamine-monophosphate kinase
MGKLNKALTLRKLGEFGFIRRFASVFNHDLPTGVEGIGDDCAVIPYVGSHSLLVTTDLLIENTHFIKRKITPQDIGYKALAVNLSDIAAMGAPPPACLPFVRVTT